MKCRDETVTLTIESPRKFRPTTIADPNAWWVWVQERTSAGLTVTQVRVTAVRVKGGKKA